MSLFPSFAPFTPYHCHCAHPAIALHTHTSWLLNMEGLRNALSQWRILISVCTAHLCSTLFEFANLHSQNWLSMNSVKKIYWCSLTVFREMDIVETDCEVRVVCWNSLLCSPAGWDLPRNAGKRVGEGSGDTLWTHSQGNLIEVYEMYNLMFI